MLRSLVGSEMCIRDRYYDGPRAGRRFRCQTHLQGLQEELPVQRGGHEGLGDGGNHPIERRPADERQQLPGGPGDLPEVAGRDSWLLRFVVYVVSRAGPLRRVLAVRH